MECNKDEALRAKQIAENKMQSGDFVGALKLAMKAQRLFPETQNITQIVTVCEVHCAAQKKLSESVMDWYGILLTQRFSDEATIKKQYRKLALLLHPDKNKSAGAEAAFKLIGEANRVLSDQTKRSSYDTRIRGPVGTTAPKVPSHHPNGSSYGARGDGSAGNYQNSFQPHPRTWNSHQQDGLQTFWTACQHCNTRYQYYKTMVNATLRCQQCSKSFMAREVGYQGAPPRNLWSSFNNKKDPPKHVPSKETSKSNGGNPCGKGLEDKFVRSCPVSMTKCAAGDGVSSKVRKREDGHGAAGATKAGVGTSNTATSKAKESQIPTNFGSKRARRSASDSRDDNKAGNGNDMKESNVQENGVDPSGFSAGVHFRRSSRKKQHVSYTETAGDGDFGSFSKRPEPDESFKTTKANVPPEETVLRNKMKIEQLNLQRKEAAKSDIDDKADNCSPPKSNLPPSFEVTCPDPDFSDFEKDKAEDCFAPNQFWAVYDNTDSMPRFYVVIKKVYLPFRLQYYWLEPNPDNKGEIDWHDADLPVACGKYKLGHTQTTRNIAMFSHQVHCIKRSGRGPYLVYPKKGETWAVFRHWDIGWSSNPEKHSEYQFEYVEVLSDYDENDGVKVAYLGRVKGFVSLFQKTMQNGICLFHVPPNELYRFSHQIPSFKMTGDEREGVPKGSFELDPAGLPLSHFEARDPDYVKMDDGMLTKESSNRKVEHAVSNESNHKTKLHERNGAQSDSPLIRRSPRSNAKSMDNGQATNHYMVREDNKNIGHREIGQPEGTDSAACQTKENFKTSQKHEKRNYHRETFEVRRSPRDLSKQNGPGDAGERTAGKLADNHSNANKSIKENVFSQSVGSDPACLKKACGVVGASCYDFKKEKSEEKFLANQIWAIYGDSDNMPNTYVQIKKIQSGPNFRLHVSKLEPCLTPKDLKRRISCGTFKVTKAKHIVSLSAFSHQLKVEPTVNSIYKIYPRKGEIWFLCKDQNYDLTSSSNQSRGECQIVEVLADTDRSIRAVALMPVDSSQQIFKAPKNQRSKTSQIEILREEVGRFSHRIPAFQHSGKDDVHLRGCWVLDPCSIPGFFHLDTWTEV